MAFDTLGEVALDAMKEGHLTMSLLMLEDYIRDATIEHALTKSGFLVFRNEGRYEFPHIALKEFFAEGLLQRIFFLLMQKSRESLKRC